MDVPIMSLDAALASHAHLVDGQDGEHAVELRGLRVVHRQRFSKWLHFLGLRSANGMNWPCRGESSPSPASHA